MSDPQDVDAYFLPGGILDNPSRAEEQIIGAALLGEIGGVGNVAVRTQQPAPVSHSHVNRVVGSAMPGQVRGNPTGAASPGPVAGAAAGTGRVQRRAGGGMQIRNVQPSVEGTNPMAKEFTPGGASPTTNTANSTSTTQSPAPSQGAGRLPEYLGRDGPFPGGAPQGPSEVQAARPLAQATTPTTASPVAAHARAVGTVTPRGFSTAVGSGVQNMGAERLGFGRQQPGYHRPQMGQPPQLAQPPRRAPMSLNVTHGDAGLYGHGLGHGQGQQSHVNTLGQARQPSAWPVESPTSATNIATGNAQPPPSGPMSPISPMSGVVGDATQRQASHGVLPAAQPRRRQQKCSGSTVPPPPPHAQVASNLRSPEQPPAGLAHVKRVMVTERTDRASNSASGTAPARAPGQAQQMQGRGRGPVQGRNVGQGWPAVPRSAGKGPVGTPPGMPSPASRGSKHSSTPQQVSQKRQEQHKHHHHQVHQQQAEATHAHVPQQQQQHHRAGAADKSRKEESSGNRGSGEGHDKASARRSAGPSGSARSVHERPARPGHPVQQEPSAGDVGRGSGGGGHHASAGDVNVASRGTGSGSKDKRVAGARGGLANAGGAAGARAKPGAEQKRGRDKGGGDATSGKDKAQDDKQAKKHREHASREVQQQQQQQQEEEEEEEEQQQQQEEEEEGEQQQHSEGGQGHPRVGLGKGHPEGPDTGVVHTSVSQEAKPDAEHVSSAQSYKEREREKDRDKGQERDKHRRDNRRSSREERGSRGSAVRDRDRHVAAKEHAHAHARVKAPPGGSGSGGGPSAAGHVSLQSIIVFVVVQLFRAIGWCAYRLHVGSIVAGMLSQVMALGVCALGVVMAAAMWLVLLGLRLHALALREVAGSVHVAVCFLFPYSFRYLVSAVDEWAPHWLPVCLWYSFLVQIFCTSNHLYQRRLSSYLVPALRILLPVAFLCEVPSGRSYLLDLDGSELLLLSFALAAVRLRCLLSPVFVASWALQVFAVGGLGSSPVLQYFQLLLSLASLHGVTMVDVMLNGRLYHARYRAGMNLTRGFRSVPLPRAG